LRHFAIVPDRHRPHPRTNQFLSYCVSDEAVVLVHPIEYGTELLRGSIAANFLDIALHGGNDNRVSGGLSDHAPLTVMARATKGVPDLTATGHHARPLRPGGETQI
jgi:hypothetical protein